MNAYIELNPTQLNWTKVRRRPSLADELGSVVVAARQPAYVDEPVEFFYAVRRPHSGLQYRLDFGDRSTATVTLNSSSYCLPAWLISSGLAVPSEFRECYLG